MAIHPVALGCTAILGLLLFGLGLVVSVTRFRCTTGSGCAADPANGLHKIVRAHGNTAEYAPFLAVLFLYFGTHDPSRAILALIVAATACRCLLVIGPACMADDGRPESRAFRRRARHVSVRRRAVSRAVRLNGGASRVPRRYRHSSVARSCRRTASTKQWIR